jgi:hypothetical protein
MIESTGMFGRLPLLFCQVGVAQFASQLTRKTCPVMVGVLSSKPPRAAYPTGTFAAATLGSSATPRTGRFGNTVFPPVTFTQVAAFAAPVPRLNPIQALPSFVPAMATLLYFGEYLTWLI